LEPKTKKFSFVPKKEEFEQPSLLKTFFALVHVCTKLDRFHLEPMQVELSLLQEVTLLPAVSLTIKYYTATEEPSLL
jgi:hypothetical protein